MRVYNWFFNDLVKVIVRGEDTDGRFDMIESLKPAGDEPPLHVHHDQDEMFYVLEGEVTIFLPGEERTLRAGEFMLAPRGIPHTYRAGDGGARSLVQTSPAGFGAFVEAVSRPADAAVLPQPAQPTPEQAAHVAAVAAEHGIELLGPPGARP
jgi:quercetin dioxygenase-like cupin family protein